MRVFTTMPDGSRKDAMMPETIGDLVFVHGVDDVPLAVQHLVGPAPANADYFVVDKTGPHYESESMLGKRTNLGTNIEAGALSPTKIFPRSPW